MKMAEPFERDVFVEHAAVSGFLYVTIDEDLLYTYRFNEHIKVRIVFNNIDERIKGQNIQAEDDKVENKSMTGSDFDEEHDFLVDNVLGDDYEVKKDFGSYRRKAISMLSEAPKIHSSRQRKKLKKNVVSQLKKMSSCDVTPKINDKLTAVENIKTESRESQVETKLNSNEIPACQINQNMKRKTKETKDDIHCSYCSQSFKSRREFKIHHRVETKNYACKKCNKVFRFEAHLLIHMQEHGLEEAVELANPYINISNDKSDELKEAIEVDNANTNNESDQSAHKSDPSLSDNIRNKRRKCCICDLVMSNLANLKLHVMGHTGEQAYKCCVCGKLNRTTGPHKKHLTSHLKDTQFRCKICNISFDSRGELCRHQLTHSFPCNLCGKVFTNKTGRYFHYKTFHKSDSNLLTCPLCGKLYACKTALASHLKYHRNRHQTQCPVCGLFVFRLKKHMQLHTSISDGIDDRDSTLFVCDKCPKQFKQRQSFNRHLSVHSEDKPYTCPECSKQFSLSGGLARHMRTHTTEKPYVCDICGKSCSQRSNLRVHMQTHWRSRTALAQKTGPSPGQHNNIVTEPLLERSVII